MDFGSVLYKAQKNEQNTRQGSGWYKAGFDPPKKEQREKKLSLNIQKFLARKEEEEKLKKSEAERKKQELLELRSKDKKSVKRVQSMLKRTKSANKSVIEDAVDNVNTAVTANGSLQPDEDDYGYVSKDAEDLYNKLINKYNSIPAEESTFKKTTSKSSKDILSTKERVKAALEREEEEKLLPRKRKRKSKTENGDDDQQHSDDESGKEEPLEKKNEEKPKSEKFRIPKKNAQMPPPLDFQSLLKLAEQKQHEPVMIEKNVEEKPERPMTSKEKQEYLRERERRMRREMLVTSNTKASDSVRKVDVKSKSDTKSAATSRPTGEKPSSAATSSSSAAKNPLQKIERTETTSNNAHKIPKPEASPKPKTSLSDPKKSLIKPASSDETSVKTNSNVKLKPSSDARSLLMKKAKKEFYAEQQRKSLNSKPAQLNEIKEKLPAKMSDPGRIKLPEKSPDSGRIPKPPEKLSKLPEKRDSSKVIDRKQVPSSHSQTVRQFPPRDEVRQFPPRDVVRQFPPPDMVRKKPQAQPVRRKFIESDDEYDSEMDDFIDDTEDPNDVSKYISEIFGYDRSRYSRYDDDEDECMESNFNQLQKEEYISTKHGILEDLADIRKTKMEKDRKKKRLLSKS